MTSAERAAAPVLVPVDFSSHSESALLWAIDIASKLNAPLVVLHVIHDPAENPGYYLKALQKNADAPVISLVSIEAAATSAMAAFLRDVATRHAEIGDPAALDSRLVVGVPATRILEFADSTGARLIVMGSHGRTGLGHMLIGSKAEQVMRMSPIPVTIVKSGNPAGRTRA